jgi:photosystem II stability/assembly factor-like uncharacterized protein
MVVAALRPWRQAPVARRHCLERRDGLDVREAIVARGAERWKRPMRRLFLSISRSRSVLAATSAFCALSTVALAAPRPTASPDAPGPSVEALWGDLQWRQVGPFRAGWSDMVVGVPQMPETFYSAAAGGGLWRTDDAGRTWRPIFDHGPQASGAVAVAPSNPNVIYYGTGQPPGRYDVQSGAGVFRSEDGGRTWTHAGLESTRSIGRIWVSPTDPNTVIVGALGHPFAPNPERGVYRSTDGGRTWTQTLKINDDTGVVDIASDPTDPDVLFAAAWQVRQYPWQSYFTPAAGPGSAIYRSSDGGVTWTRLAGDGWPKGALGRIGLASTHTAHGTRLYATVDAGGKDSGLYRTDDGGAHWLKANSVTAETSGYFSRVAVQPHDPDTVYLVGQSVRRCTDAGKTCEIIKGSPGGDDYHFVWVNPLRPDHIALASDQGTVISVDGGKTWSSWYNQPTGQFYHLATDNRFPYWIYAGQQDSGTVATTGRGDYGAITFRDWRPVGGDERDYDIPDPKDPSIVYASGLGGHITRWDSNTGQSETISPWPVSSYGARPTTVKYRYNWVTPLVASETGPDTIYLGAQLLFASTDTGRRWSIISPDLTGKVEGARNCDGDVAIADARACGYGVIISIQPSARHAKEIWVGTDDGLVQLTRDGGQHWADVSPKGLPAFSKIQTVEVSRLEDGVAYLAIDNQRLDDYQPHVMATRDYGATWRDITANLPRGAIISVVRADPARPGLLYAGGDGGVSVSLDDGATWRGLQQNLPTAWVRDMVVHGDDLVVATQGRAIWILDDVTPLRQASGRAGEQRALLFNAQTAIRVHPNNNRDTPLPPETPHGQNPPAGAVIDYWLGAPARSVEMEIVDGHGRIVRAFSDEATQEPQGKRYFMATWIKPSKPLSREAGEHRVVWDLHWPRPKAISFGYSIAANPETGTPLLPEGPFAVPGDYQVRLKVDGRESRAPLRLVEDPRVRVTPADLDAELSFSLGLYPKMEAAYVGAGEVDAVRDQLEARARDAAGKPDIEKAIKALLAKLTAKPGAPSFRGVNGELSTMESEMEGADAAPNGGQQALLEEANRQLDQLSAQWKGVRGRDLDSLNASLKKAGLAPVEVPPAAKLHPTDEGEGTELP